MTGRAGYGWGCGLCELLLPRKAKHANVVRLDGTGHHLVEERPAEVLRLLAESLPQPS